MARKKQTTQQVKDEPFVIKEDLINGSLCLGMLGHERIPHYAAIGYFLVQYAGAEAMINVIARRLTGISEEKARIMLAKKRLKDLSDHINAMMTLDNLPTDRQRGIQECIRQLDLIGDERNKLVHHSVSYKEAALHVSNAMIARIENQAQLTVFSLKDLDDMTSDCIRVSLRLLSLYAPDIEPV